MLHKLWYIVRNNKHALLTVAEIVANTQLQSLDEKFHGKYFVHCLILSHEYAISKNKQFCFY